MTIDPKLEARIREKAESEGLTVSAYVERLVGADQAAEEELESLAREGLNSGAPIDVGPGYWEEKHRRLGERLKRTGRPIEVGRTTGPGFGRRQRLAPGQGTCRTEEGENADQCEETPRPVTQGER